MSTDETAADRPLLRVIAGGEPTAAELAALVVVLTAVGEQPAATPDARDRRRGGWADRTASPRRPQRAGVGAWRASAR